MSLLSLAPAEPLLIASIALAGVARALVGHWSVRARAAERIGLYALAQIGGPALTLALSLIGFVLIAPNLTVAFLAMAIGHAVVALPMLRGADYRPPRAGLHRQTLAKAFRYGVFTTIGTGLAWVSMQSVRFVAEAMIGAAAVGLLHVGWGVGQRLATQIGVLTTTALFPIAAGKAGRKASPRASDSSWSPGAAAGRADAGDNSRVRACGTCGGLAGRRGLSRGDGGDPAARDPCRRDPRVSQPLFRRGAATRRGAAPDG